jgi:tRNA G18 (ribose-2'-O)-methylase SpoU
LAVVQIPASHSLDDLLALNSSAFKQQTVDPITSAAYPILLALDEIQDPGNMGDYY